MVIKLSEAMREGAKHTKPQIGRYSALRRDGIHCCALGAAIFTILEGELPPDNRCSVYRIFKNHKIDIDVWVEHPGIPNKDLTPLKFVIQDLNDSCDWTREQIADWLERLGY